MWRTSSPLTSKSKNGERTLYVPSRRIGENAMTFSPQSLRAPASSRKAVLHEEILHPPPSVS
jgi:hypothetical protein